MSEWELTLSDVYVPPRLPISDKRQLVAINRYARRAGYEIVDTFYDAAVSGADPVNERPVFAHMLERLLGNGARTIIVESPAAAFRQPIERRGFRDADMRGGRQFGARRRQLRPAAPR